MTTSSFLSVSRRHFLAGTASMVMLPAAVKAAFAAAPAKGGTLRVSVDQAVSVLHPLLVRVNPEYLVSELLYSGLTRLKPDMTVEPDLALSWSADDALKVWTFKLRDGVTFHDGSKCTAEDVVASFDAILDPKNATPGAKNVGPIEKVEAVDATTVKFTLSVPYSDFPVALSYLTAKIIPAKIAKDDFKRLSSEAIGTGPFKLVSFEPDRKIVVKRNPHYYDPERPYVDGVEVNVYPDASAEGSALIAGDTDLMQTLRPTDYDKMKSSDGVDALNVASGQFCNVNFGCDSKPFNDPRVRKALALTIDRAAMVDFVTEGHGQPGNDTPINSSYHYYDDAPLRQANIEEAKKLLAEAGYPNGLKETLIASEKPSYRTQLAVALREMAKPAGFEIEVQTMPHATYLEQVWKKNNFYIGFYNMQPTEDGIFSLLYTSDAPWNETRWNNKEFDKVVYQARETTDEAKRKDLYAKAQKLMHDEVPTIIPVFFDILSAKRSWVQNYQLHPRGSVFRLDYVALGADAPTRS